MEINSLAKLNIKDGLGEYALKKGWDKIIHRTDRCDLSLFTLGKRLLKYFLKKGLSIPSFCLTLSGLALE